MSKTVAKVVMIALIVGVTMWAETGMAAEAKPESSGLPGNTALGTNSLWRCSMVWQTELVESEAGALKPFQKGAKGMVEKITSALPPKDWMAADFPDDDWAPSTGPVSLPPTRRDLSAICLRGRFEVADPASAGELKLSVSYRGGAVVYLNGKEIARGDMPDGVVAIDALAKSYPKECYVSSNGVLLDKPPAALTRTVTCTLPAAGLRKGTNVLAVELHRAATSALFYEATSTSKDAGRRAAWTLLALEGLDLSAGAGSSASAIVATPGKPLVWPGNPVLDGWDDEPGERSGNPSAVRIAGSRNGAFSGLAYVQIAEQVKTLGVKVSDLSGVKQASGSAVIPSAACRVRYGVAGDVAPAGSARRHRDKAAFLGVLENDAPKSVALPAGASAVTISVWLTVQVARDTRPGDYSGIVTVTVNDDLPVSLPVALSVADFCLPDPKDFRSYPDLIQSPESVALRYGVPLWSEEHWALLDKTFALLGQIGVKEVFVPLIGRTNMGNEHSMVRWIKQADGGYQHDFSIAERYLDLAVKHLGKVPIVILYVWTPTHGGGGFGAIIDKPKNDVPMVFTVCDPATKEMKLETGPDWGTPQSKPFWKPVIEGMRRVLAARGLEKSIAYGLVNDRVPSKTALDDLNDCGADIRWVMYAHGRGTAWAGRPLAADCCVWGTGGPKLIGEQFHKFSWMNTVPTTVFPRYGAGILGHVRTDSALAMYQMQIEAYCASGYNGVGNVGADFYPIPAAKDPKTGKGSPKEATYTVMDRFITWQRPGAPTMSNGCYLFPGPKEPLATVRFELFRLGVQETEARITIEMAVADKAKTAKLGDELTKRALALLNDRTRLIALVKETGGESAGWLHQAAGWQNRTGELYRLAGEVNAKLGE